MKLSAGTIGTLAFTALATAAFVWMAKRPAVEISAMQFGMPTSKASGATPKVVETKKEPEAAEATVTTEEKEKADTQASKPASSSTASDEVATEKVTTKAPQTESGATTESEAEATQGSDATNTETNSEAPKVEMPEAGNTSESQPDVPKETN